MADLQTLLAPLLALGGTVAVAGIGFYQWRKQHSKPNRSAVAESRRKAAEVIWAQLEEINLKLRPFGEDRREIDIRSELRLLNELFLRNSLYLDDSLQLSINTYVKHLHKVSEKIEQYQEYYAEWAASMPAPSEELLKRRNTQYRGINQYLDELRARRAEVKSLLLAAADG